MFLNVVTRRHVGFKHSPVFRFLLYDLSIKRLFIAQIVIELETALVQKTYDKAMPVYTKLTN